MNECIQIYLKSRNMIGPIFYSYVSWVLRETQKRHIQTLYFLARDGYVLQKIAQMICKVKKLQISCRYLYCSRASLRMPSYHLIGEEAFDLVFSGGYHVTVQSFFERAAIPALKWNRILNEADIKLDIKQELSFPQIAECREKFLRSHTFRECLFAGSKESYQTAIGYLKQEGLLDEKQVAIVDSGWTGSMQRSLRQLLESAGFDGRMTGFYFGLFRKAKELQDGEYVSWYFSADRCKKNKILFCNNLLECFLSAPHGMTSGYEIQQGRYRPILKETSKEVSLRFIQAQVKGILDGAKLCADRRRMLTKKQCEQILRRVMTRPTREEVLLYGKFLFCDDITESYRYPLADERCIETLQEQLLPRRFVRMICRRSSHPAQLFWVYGEVALIKNPIRRNIYWFNEYVSQWYRMTLQ